MSFIDKALEANCKYAKYQLIFRYFIPTISREGKEILLPSP